MLRLASVVRAIAHRAAFQPEQAMRDHIISAGKRVALADRVEDGNHPLAGTTLRVQVRVAEVRDPTHAETTSDPGRGCRLPGGGLH